MVRGLRKHRLIQGPDLAHSLGECYELINVSNADRPRASSRRFDYNKSQSNGIFLKNERWVPPLIQIDRLKDKFECHGRGIGPDLTALHLSPHPPNAL